MKVLKGSERLRIGQGARGLSREKVGDSRMYNIPHILIFILRVGGWREGLHLVGV